MVPLYFLLPHTHLHINLSTWWYLNIFVWSFSGRVSFTQFHVFAVLSIFLLSLLLALGADVVDGIYFFNFFFSFPIWWHLHSFCPIGRLHSFGISSLETNKLPYDNIVAFQNSDHCATRHLLDHILLPRPASWYFSHRSNTPLFCLSCPWLLLSWFLFCFVLVWGFSLISDSCSNL